MWDWYQPPIYYSKWILKNPLKFLYRWCCESPSLRRCSCVERENTSTEESGVSEHSGGHQDLTYLCVCSAGSRGRALTLVSFTKGVSPPQRSALYTLLRQTLKFTKWRGSLLFPRTRSESKTTKHEFWPRAHFSLRRPTSQTHTELWKVSVCVI